MGSFSPQQHYNKNFSIPPWLTSNDGEGITRGENQKLSNSTMSHYSMEREKLCCYKTEDNGNKLTCHPINDDSGQPEDGGDLFRVRSITH